MSHQTGIRANKELLQFLSRCRNGSVRAVKISIENEQMVLSQSADVADTWRSDFDIILSSLIVEDQPCYILYRLDTKSTSDYDWLFISWCPDTATVRQKMLYASTKATLKQQFGSSEIKSELHATTRNEITLAGYERHKKEFMGPGPLSNREEELQEIRQSQIQTSYNVDSKQQTMASVAFPMTSAAKEAIVEMARGVYDYLQFEIDLNEEIINVVCSERLTVSKLPRKIPEDSARYHLFNFRHQHDSDYLHSVVFIYSMPGYKCSIKERMLYSSCKNPTKEVISQLGVEIAKTLEIESGDELTEQFLYEELHPVLNLHRPQFVRPKGPPNRGPKRITKPTY